MANSSTRAVVVVASIAVASLAGCATVTPYAAANGATAYEISCTGGRWRCSEEAQNACGGGHYVVLEEDTSPGAAYVTTGTTPTSRYGTGFQPSPVMYGGENGSLKIQCIEDYLAKSNAPLATSANPDGSPGRRPSEALVCDRTYADIPRVAADWSLLRGVAAKPLPPLREEFMRACTAVPEGAQLCLNAKYHANHGDRCAKTLAALDDASAQRLDALLLVTPSARSADAAP